MRMGLKTQRWMADYFQDPCQALIQWEGGDIFAVRV